MTDTSEDGPEWTVRFTTMIEVTVTVHAPDEDAAADLSWQVAEDYAQTVHGHSPSRVRASMSFDGIGADTVERTGAEE